MTRIFQVIPLYLESDSETRKFFSDSNFNDLDTISGSRFILNPPGSMVGLFEDEGHVRYPGLNSRDLPCLWAEDNTNAHFLISIRELKMEGLRDLFCDLSDAAGAAQSLAEWEEALHKVQALRRNRLGPRLRLEAPNTATMKANGESEGSGNAQGSEREKGKTESDQFGWTIEWGRIAGIGGLALAAFVTVLSRFSFPALPEPYIPMLLLLLYGVAILGCVVWMVERLITRTGRRGVGGAIAFPMIFLVFALVLGVFAFLTIPRSASSQFEPKKSGVNPKPGKEKDGDDLVPVIPIKDEPEIHGMVLDAEGRAAGGALVSVAGYGKDATFTDATGSFTLPSHTERLHYVTLHAERPPEGPANLDKYVVGSESATLKLGPTIAGGPVKHMAGNSKRATLDAAQTPPAETKDGQAVRSETPDIRPHSQGFCDSFQQFMGSESALATLAERAFSRKDYRCVVADLEQARKVQSSGVWERDYPFLAAAYLLLDRPDPASFRNSLNAMTGEMRRTGGYLHHGATIGFAVNNLSEVRSYLDSPAQKIIDATIEEATRIRSTMPD